MSENVRKKPNDTFVSDAAWKIFDEFADGEGCGTHPDDWIPWFDFFEKGYEVRTKEVDDIGLYWKGKVIDA